MSKYIDITARQPIWIFRAFDGKEFPVYELEDHEITQARLERVQLALLSLNRGWSLETWAKNLVELEKGYVAYNDFATALQFEKAIIEVYSNIFNSKELGVIESIIDNKATKEEILAIRTKLKTAATSEQLGPANAMLKAYMNNKIVNSGKAKEGLAIVRECIKRNEADFVCFNPELDLICTLFVTANESIENPTEQLQSLKKQLFFWDSEGLMLLKKKSEPKLIKHSQLLVNYFPNVFQAILQAAQMETITEIFQK